MVFICSTSTASATWILLQGSLSMPWVMVIQHWSMPSKHRLTNFGTPAIFTEFLAKRPWPSGYAMLLLLSVSSSATAVQKLLKAALNMHANIIIAVAKATGIG